MKKTFNIIYLVFLPAVLVDAVILDCMELGVFNTLIIIAIIPAIMLTVKEIKE